MHSIREHILLGLFVLPVVFWCGAACAEREPCNGDRSLRVLSDGVPLRVATFNIENFNARRGDEQFEAAVDVLERVGADVVCVQEMISHASFIELATDAGYPHRVIVATYRALGFRKSGVMSVYPISTWSMETSETLSGDPAARDIMRNFVVAQIDVPGAVEQPVFIGNHWASLRGDPGEFMRSIESIRTMQITDRYDSRIVPYVVAGDMNDDLLDRPDIPRQFTEEPAGLPDGFQLGIDMTFPMNNSAFDPLRLATGPQELIVVDALQLDGQDATHGNGGRIDYLWHSVAATIVGSEVYDSRDENGSGLFKYGEPLPAGTSRTASDHLLVFADLKIPGTAVTSFEVMTGTLLEGDVRQMMISDDSHVRIRSGYGRTLFDFHHMKMIVNASTSVVSPAILDITIESRIEEPSGLAKVRAYNHSTGQFDSVAQYGLGNADHVEIINGLDAGNYVNDLGEIVVRIDHLVFVPFFAFTFESFIDQVIISAN